MRLKERERDMQVAYGKRTNLSIKKILIIQIKRGREEE